MRIACWRQDVVAAPAPRRSCYGSTPPARVLRWSMVAWLVTIAGCAHQSEQVRHVGGVVIDCKPADAEILVNDQYIGTVAQFDERAISLPVGLVRLELRRDGYFSAYRELHVVAGLRQSLSVELRPRPF
jgi:hypothetical protein